MTACLESNDDMMYSTAALVVAMGTSGGSLIVSPWAVVVLESGSLSDSIVVVAVVGFVDVRGQS